jgi:hypothetical protein
LLCSRGVSPIYRASMLVLVIRISLTLFWCLFTWTTVF